VANPNQPQARRRKMNIKMPHGEILSEQSNFYWPKPYPPLEEIPDPNSDFSASIERDNLVNLIWEYNPPNEKWRLAAQLHYQDDLSINDIAKVMYTKPGTVKAWLHRWRKEVRVFLSKEWGI
jgi:DNA-directed RNA polymerase specialized sigma24 family protein